MIETEHLAAAGEDLDPTAEVSWVLFADGFDALREGSLEARYAISNGLLGVRGARATARGTRWLAPPRTYVAGLFDTPSTAPLKGFCQVSCQGHGVACQATG